jgi:hypothetical protein
MTALPTARTVRNGSPLASVSPPARMPAACMLRRQPISRSPSHAKQDVFQSRLVRTVTKPWEADLEVHALPPGECAAFSDPDYVIHVGILFAWHLIIRRMSLAPLKAEAERRAHQARRASRGLAFELLEKS